MPTEPMIRILPDGWLADQIRATVGSLRAMYDRNIFAHLAGAAEAPRISGDEARDLYQRLDKRFRSWTGMSLKEFGDGR